LVTIHNNIPAISNTKAVKKLKKEHVTTLCYTLLHPLPQHKYSNIVSHFSSSLYILLSDLSSGKDEFFEQIALKFLLKLP